MARQDANPAVEGRLAIYLGLRRLAEDHPLVWFPGAFVDPYYVTAFARTEGAVDDYDPSISRNDAQRLAGLAEVRISSRREARHVLILVPRGDPDEPLRLLRWGVFFFVPESVAVEYLDAGQP